MDNGEKQPKSQSAAHKTEQLGQLLLKTGESFGSYRVVKCLCAGLVAHYYHMQHIRDLHDVTVGVFHPHAAKDQRLFRRLEGLQKTISTFDHECIPRINGVTVIKERLCLFLEPVKGHSLSQHLGAHGEPGQKGLSIKAATRIIAQLYGALGYAHSQGVDHRDLESDMIYVQQDGSIRILGLGVKAALGIELFELVVSASVSPLASNKTMGRLNSFDVMSPEYRSGVSEDSRVDVYAVGFVGYWLITGRKADLTNYEAPSQFVEDLSPGWDDFFAQSLQRDKDKRLQSCKSALLALKATDEQPESEGAGLVQRQIERIPVPKQIVERGELAARIYRLFIIGLVGLTLTAICASFLTVSYTEEADYSRDVARLADSSENAALRLEVKPPVARVEFVGYEERFIANRGQLDLAVQPGQYKLRLSAPHHIEQFVALDIPAGANSPKDLSVELKPAWVDIVIRTEPGAAVSVIDERGLEIELGVANEEGIFSLEKGIFAGSEQVLVSKEGYQPKALENQAIEFGAVAEIEAPLAPLFAEVKVFTEPAGAAISIDEVEVGLSPITLDEVIPGDHFLVAAQLAGYRPIGRRVEVKPGAEMVVDFGDLVPLSGTLRIAVKVAGEDAPGPASLYDELEVVLDGEPIPYGDVALNSVSVGERRVRLQHPLYISEEATLEVEDRGEYALQFLLEPRPGEVRLDIPGNMDAEVRLNGVAVRLENSIIRIPANKAVEFELRIHNHLTMVRTFELPPNGSFVWEVDPVPIPGPTAGQSWTLPYFGIPFAWVSPGSFAMGSPLPEHARLPNEGPPTQVRFTDGFWVGLYEVTQGHYREIMGQNPSQFGNPRRPVEGVTWYEAKSFCETLNRFEREAGRLPDGYIYRLPTEAEWEYAARAGTTTPFYFGSEADASKGHFRGVYPRDRSDGQRSPEGGYGTATVGRYPPNPWGLHDIHGNVREWTLDVFNARLPGDALVDPQPRTEGSRIAVRGGGWEDSAARVRSAAREQVSPDVESNAIGFRVVLAPEY